MKIALVTPGFSADEQDWCIPALLNLVRLLAREHEVHVFTLRYPHHRRRYRVYGASVHPLGGATVGGVGRLPLLTRALAAIVREARRGPFDVIHALWADEPGFLAVMAGRVLGAPTVVSLLGGELVRMPELGYGHGLSRAGRAMIALALRGADRVTVGSATLYQRALAHVPPARLAQIPLGVDIERFFPAPAPPSAFRVGDPALLHAASLLPIKDQATLLRAFQRVVAARPAAHLHIVGEGPLRDELQRLAASLGVAGHVTLHGNVSHEALPACYRAADLFLLSSRYESQGMVVLEAAACGVPTVGTAVGILPELGPAARAVPIGDADALAGALLALLAQPEQLAAMGRAALALARQRYALPHTVAQWVAL